MTQLPNLYKYTDGLGVQRILENRTLRLSSPLVFNDPFDTHLGAALGLDVEEFARGLMPAFFEFARGDLDYSKLRPGPLAAQVVLINQSLKNASKDEIAAIREEIVNTSPSDVWDIPHLERLNEDTVASLRENFERYGVFCSSHKNDNLLMWSHYSDHHRGAVIGLSPNGEKDSALLVSKPVRYSAERPLMYRTPRQLIEQSLTMLAIDSTKMIVDGLIYTKSLDWAYESEWRLYIPNFIPKGKFHEFMEIHPEEISTIYFGCRSPRLEREKIMRMGKHVNPGMTFYQATMARRDYALEWESLH